METSTENFSIAHVSEGFVVHSLHEHLQEVARRASKAADRSLPAMESEAKAGSPR